MNIDWLATWEALRSVYAEEAYSNIAVNEAVSHYRNCDSGFVRYMTKGVIRDSLRLDAVVDRLSKKGIKGIKLRTLIIIKMGLYAIDAMSGVPDYAAVNESVKLAKKLSRGSEGFVNGLLRNYLRERDNIIVTDNEEIKYNMPHELIDLLKEQYGDEAYDIIKGLNSTPYLCIRTNLLRTDRDALIMQLQNEDIEAEPVIGTDTAVKVKGNGLLSGQCYKKGLFSVQSLASIMAVEAFRPAEGSKVLDMCAAPGGKSCAMAELMDGCGEITACDIYEHRLKLISANANRLGIKIINTRLLDGTITEHELKDSYDYVLADVPCSGLGVIPSKPEIKLKTDVKEYSELVKIQKIIIRNAFSYVKPGGLIMYSTCTINRNENEGVTEEFVNSHKCAQIVEKRLILPYNNSVGFYYCIIKKTE